MEMEMGDRRVDGYRVDGVRASSSLSTHKETELSSLPTPAFRVGEKSKSEVNCTYENSISHSESDSPDESATSTSVDPHCRQRKETKGDCERNGPRPRRPEDNEPISVLYQNSSEQICVDIDIVPAAAGEGSKEDPGPARVRTSRKVPVLILLFLVKLVDLSFHSLMFVLLVYATYISAVFCQQEFEVEWCVKNSTRSPVILSREEWRMPVRDWGLIFSIFHCAYFLLAVLADIFFFSLYSNINKYILTIFPVERGFLFVLLVTDSVVYIFSGNLYLVTRDAIVLGLLLVSTLFTLIDTIYVLPQLRYLARLDLVWLRKSGKFFSKWRPVLNFVLVMVITLYNLLCALKSRPSLEVIPLAVFGFLYAFLLLIFFILIFVRKTKLKSFLNDIGESGGSEPSVPRDCYEGGANPSLPRDWDEGRCDLVLGILGLASINYFSVSPVAKTLNFIFQTFVL